MKLDEYWPCKLCASTAGIVGILLVMGGSFHLEAVISIALAQDKPFDYRMISLIATSGILIFPGLLSIATCRWIWQGREWAYVTCIAGTMALMIYLILLLFIEAPEPPAKPSTGSEVDYFSMIVGAYLVVLIAVWIWLRRTLRRIIDAA